MVQLESIIQKLIGRAKPDELSQAENSDNNEATINSHKEICIPSSEEIIYISFYEVRNGLALLLLLLALDKKGFRR